METIGQLETSSTTSSSASPFPFLPLSSLHEHATSFSGAGAFLQDPSFHLPPAPPKKSPTNSASSNLPVPLLKTPPLISSAFSSPPSSFLSLNRFFPGRDLIDRTKFERQRWSDCLFGSYRFVQLSIYTYTCKCLLFRLAWIAKGVCLVGEKMLGKKRMQYNVFAIKLSFACQYAFQFSIDDFRTILSFVYFLSLTSLSNQTLYLILNFVIKTLSYDFGFSILLVFLLAILIVQRVSGDATHFAKLSSCVFPELAVRQKRNNISSGTEGES